MRAVKAKALRKALAFHPGQPREYTTGKPSIRLGNELGPDGNRRPFAVTGTIKATGKRSSYQAVKRNSALTRMVLAAPRLEAA